MPTDIDAIVIVIISSGIAIIDIIERIALTEKAGIKRIKNDLRIFLNNINNIKKIAPKTNIRDFICEENKLCNKLLYKMPRPEI